MLDIDRIFVDRNHAAIANALSYWGNISVARSSKLDFVSPSLIDKWNIFEFSYCW